MYVNWAAVGACVLPNAGGWINGLRTRNEMSPTSWTKTLKKAPWSPPDWVFGPVWTSLYTSMGYASYLVWRDCGNTFGGRAALPLGLYASQMCLNWAWPNIFFIHHSLKWSLVDILVLSVNVAACGVSFYGVNQTAGLLLVPYLAWLMLASSLNYRLYRDNPVPQITASDEKKLK